MFHLSDVNKKKETDLMIWIIAIESNYKTTKHNMDNSAFSDLTYVYCINLVCYLTFGLFKKKTTKKKSTKIKTLFFIQM